MNSYAGASSFFKNPSLSQTTKPQNLPQNIYKTPNISSKYSFVFEETSKKWPRLSIRRVYAAAQTDAAVVQPSTRLADLDLCSVVNIQGYINPEIPLGTEATIFAVYDQAKSLHYIGFSKNLRSSLLTVFSRRPDKTHHYRALHLSRMDQQEMMGIRSSWFDQVGGPPQGNKLPAERSAWQEPASPFTISERGKVAAAEELAKGIMSKIRSRGCKEEYILNRDLLTTEGKVEFLAAAELSPDELERQRREAEVARRSTRKCSVIIDGETVPFEIFFKSNLVTNGGHMFDLRLSAHERETAHRIIVGKPYYEDKGIEPEDVVERVLSFLLAKHVARHTEGMLLSSDFPSNYFAVSEVHQFFDDFEAYFDEDWLSGTTQEFWRFNRTQDYGYKGANEDAQALARQFKIE